MSMARGCQQNIQMFPLPSLYSTLPHFVQYYLLPIRMPPAPSGIGPLSHHTFSPLVSPRCAMESISTPIFTISMPLPSSNSAFSLGHV